MPHAGGLPHPRRIHAVRMGERPPWRSYGLRRGAMSRPSASLCAFTAMSRPSASLRAFTAMSRPSASLCVFTAMSWPSPLYARSLQCHGPPPLYTRMAFALVDNFGFKAPDFQRLRDEIALRRLPVFEAQPSWVDSAAQSHHAADPSLRSFVAPYAIFPLTRPIQPFTINETSKGCSDCFI